MDWGSRRLCRINVPLTINILTPLTTDREPAISHARPRAAAKTLISCLLPAFGHGAERGLKAGAVRGAASANTRTRGAAGRVACRRGAAGQAGRADATFPDATNTG